jgi:hypothetical protein
MAFFMIVSHIHSFLNSLDSGHHHDLLLAVSLVAADYFGLLPWHCCHFWIFDAHGHYMISAMINATVQFAAAAGWLLMLLFAFICSLSRHGWRNLQQINFFTE